MNNSLLGIETLRSLKSSNKEQKIDALTARARESFEELFIKEPQVKEVVEDEKNKEKGAYSFRLPLKYRESFDVLPGRGVGEKVRNLMDFYFQGDSLFKEQVAPIKSILYQFNNLTKLDINSIPYESVLTISKQLETILQLIKYSQKLHGKHLTSFELNRIDAILDFSRRMKS